MALGVTLSRPAASGVPFPEGRGGRRENKWIREKPEIPGEGKGLAVDHSESI